MQSLDVTNIENHIIKHHFQEIKKDSTSEKKISTTLDISPTLNIHVINRFHKLSALLKEKIGLQNRLQLSSELTERPFHSLHVEKHVEVKSATKLVCNACNRELDSDICRIIITRNIDEEPQFFSFHFFSPCWNLEDFSQKYPNLVLDKVAFSIPENISISESCVKDLQNNLSFWD